MAKKGESGCVYILKNKSTNHLKIGHSKNTTYQRCSQISRGNHWRGDFNVVCDYFFEDCCRAEKEIHSKLSSSHLGHEVFDVSSLKVAKMLKDMGGLDYEAQAQKQAEVLRGLLQ